jgi:hypothetical protein
MTEIARRLGVKLSYLNWKISEGTFGKLESRQGQRKHRKPQGVDDPAKDILFGMNREEREQRMRKIQESWTDSERCERLGGFHDPHRIPQYRGGTPKW